MTALILAAAISWTIHDAPYRAVLQAEKTSPNGIAITLPEFGQTLPDLSDAILTDAAGKIVPLAPVWRGEGQKALFLAQDMKPGADYYLYFGGGKHRPVKTWTPQVSLLLETRRLPAGFKASDLDSGKSLQAAWELARESDGAGWVDDIFTGPNPFGPSQSFLAHYTGWLHTENLKEITLYTQSSDASFVFVNGKLEFGWPGRHGGWATAETVNRKTVTVAGPVTRIDYYQGKMDGDPPGAVLGWVQNKTFAPIPASAWLCPGTAKVVRVEDAAGREVPVPSVTEKSALGFDGYWYHEVVYSVPGKPDVRRVVAGMRYFRVSENGMVRQVNFTEAVPQASINRQEDVQRYLQLIAKENPAPEAVEAFFVFAENFSSTELAAQFAGMLLRQMDSSNKFWLPATVAWLRGLAMSNPRQALTELNRMNPNVRKKYSLALDELELEILAFDLRDASIVQRATVMATQFPKSQLARLAGVRVGDYFRLNGQMAEAVAQYRKVQSTIVEESEGRKLPAQDRAYSITVTDLLVQGHRDEAEAKLEEWETSHPMAKLTSDFLLLRARMLMQFCRWREALMEMDSFEKLQPDSPYQIDAAFYRAQVLYELGKQDEARKLWTSIYEKYPRHELAEKSRELAQKQ
jgi:TolA-binding protein